MIIVDENLFGAENSNTQDTICKIKKNQDQNLEVIKEVEETKGVNK